MRLTLTLLALVVGCAQSPYEQEKPLVWTPVATGVSVGWGWSTPPEAIGPGAALITSACAAWPLAPGTAIRVVRYPALLPKGMQGSGPAGPTGTREATSYRLEGDSSWSSWQRLDGELGFGRPRRRHGTIVLSWRLRSDGAIYVGDAPWEIYHFSRHLPDTAPMP